MLLEIQTILAEWGIGGDQLVFGLACDMICFGLVLKFRAAQKEASAGMEATQ